MYRVLVSSDRTGFLKVCVDIVSYLDQDAGPIDAVPGDGGHTCACVFMAVKLTN